MMTPNDKFIVKTTSALKFSAVALEKLIVINEKIETKIPIIVKILA